MCSKGSRGAQPMPFRYRLAQPDSVGGRQPISIMPEAFLRAPRGGNHREPAAAAPRLSHTGVIGGVIRAATGHPTGGTGEAGSIDTAPDFCGISGDSSVLGLRTLDRCWLQIIRHCLHTFKHSLGKPANFSRASVE
jgi:hypothetical protein